MTRRTAHRMMPLALVGFGALAGCAAHPLKSVASAANAVAARPPQPPPQASGVWDWVYRSVDDQGDLRVEQEEWHLSQQGGHIDGYYDRAVTMLSTDERLFRCNQKLGFTKVTRVRLAGEVAGAQVQLREIGFETKPGPCEDGARSLVEYSGVVSGATMALRWGPEVSQTLIRRAADATPTPLADVGSPLTLAAAQGNATPASTTSQSADGVWQWELRSIDAEGDERVESEEWHLNETPTGISGYYNRTVKKVRGDGNFACNNEPSFTTNTRYDIVGQRVGDRISLSEVDYRAVPSRCDNALRRLDTYDGRFSDPDSLILSWGPGNQLLRRQGR